MSLHVATRRAILTARGGSLVVNPIQDTYLWDAVPHGADDRINLKGRVSANARFGLFQFSLAGIPVGATIQSVDMYIYLGYWEASITIPCYPLAAGRLDWESVYADSVEYKNGGNWASVKATDPINDHDGTMQLWNLTIGSNPGVDGEVQFESNEIVVSYVEKNIGDMLNVFMYPQGNNNYIFLRSVEYVTKSLRPKLVVKY